MKIVVFRTPEERERGLQGIPRIPDDTLFVFIGPFLVGRFHSRNVPEPFDIAFMSSDFHLISKHRVTPPDMFVEAPDGAALAIEAKAGVLDEFTT